MIQLTSTIDSLKASIDHSLKAKDFPLLFNNASALMDIYRQNGQDTLFNVCQMKIDSLILASYRSNDNFSVYSSIEQFPYVSQYVLDSLKSQIQHAKQGVLTRLSANLDYDELTQFQSQYPSLFYEQVTNLKDMAQANLKTSALREALKGNTQDLIDYRDRFGEKDIAVDKALENALYRAFETLQNEENASRYLLYYPDSPRSPRIREYLTTLHQQKEMEALAKQVLIRKYEQQDTTHNRPF
jgi:hypothetical protein